MVPTNLYIKLQIYSKVNNEFSYCIKISLIVDKSLY